MKSMTKQQLADKAGVSLISLYLALSPLTPQKSPSPLHNIVPLQCLPETTINANLRLARRRESSATSCRPRFTTRSTRRKWFMRLQYAAVSPSKSPPCNQINNDFPPKYLHFSNNHRIFAPETYKQQRLWKQRQQEDDVVRTP